MYELFRISNSIEAEGKLVVAQGRKREEAGGGGVRQLRSAGFLLGVTKIFYR